MVKAFEKQYVTCTNMFLFLNIYFKLLAKLCVEKDAFFRLHKSCLGNFFMKVTLLTLGRFLHRLKRAKTSTGVLPSGQKPVQSQKNNVRTTFVILLTLNMFLPTGLFYFRSRRKMRKKLFCEIFSFLSIAARKLDVR